MLLQALTYFYAKPQLSRDSIHIHIPTDMAISLQWKFQYVASSFDISLCKTLTVQRLHYTPMLTDMAISVHWKLCCVKLSYISMLVYNIKVQDLPQLATNRYRPLGNPQTLELATIIVTSRCMTANNQGKRRRS